MQRRGALDVRVVVVLLLRIREASLIQLFEGEKEGNKQSVG